jgi:hypothetical protein
MPTSWRLLDMTTGVQSRGNVRNCFVGDSLGRARVFMELRVGPVARLWPGPVTFAVW